MILLLTRASVYPSVKSMTKYIDLISMKFKSTILFLFLTALLNCSNPAKAQDFQTIISREKSAFKSAVLSVGAIRSGNSFNTIPGESELRLTLRTFKREVREKIIRRIHEMAIHPENQQAFPRRSGLRLYWMKIPFQKFTIRQSFLRSSEKHSYRSKT